MNVYFYNVYIIFLLLKHIGNSLNSFLFFKVGTFLRACPKNKKLVMKIRFFFLEICFNYVVFKEILKKLYKYGELLKINNYR